MSEKIRKTIVVIGDVGVDCYKYGVVKRISPEFPVLVLKSPSQTGYDFPAMAANVCYQMNNLDVDVFLFSFLNKNTYDIFKNFNFNVENSLILDDCVVSNKIRFYEDNFPLLRWDVEKENYGLENIEKHRSELSDSFELFIQNKKVDIVILSDYNKGIFDEIFAQKIIKICNEKNIKTIVDPKELPLSKWKNCTYFKPNSTEAKHLSGLEKTQDQIRKIFDDLECKAVVLTQEGNGFNVIFNGEKYEFKPETKLSIDKVNSKIGAGDAFLSMLSVCLSNDIEFIESCKFAFAAGTKYVQEKHNKPLSRIDFINILKNNSSKVISFEESNLLNHRDFNLVFTNGCFDFGLTSAHIDCLIFAKKQGDKLVVGINTDESIRRLKGQGRPIMSLCERIKLLSSLEFVDYIVPFDQDTPLQLIESIKPSIIVKGGDYKKEDVVGNNLAEVRIFNFIENNLSTTEKIIKAYEAMKINSAD